MKKMFTKYFSRIKETLIEISQFSTQSFLIYIISVANAQLFFMYVRTLVGKYITLTRLRECHFAKSAVVHKEFF